MENVAKSEIFEDVPCDHCGAGENSVVAHTEIPEQQQSLFQSDRISVVQCENCGLIFANPRPTLETISEYYEQYYSPSKEKTFFFNSEFKAEELTSETGFERANRDPKTCRSILEKLKSVVSKPGKVLDVGCGQGGFIQFANSHGWEGHGIEISSEAASYARDELGLEVKSGAFSDAEYPPGFFDAVTFLNVFEHLNKPATYLEKARIALRDGGALFLNTPNTVVRHRGLAGVFLPEHYYFFSVKTLTAMLRKQGFEVVHCSTTDMLNAKVTWHKFLRSNKLKPQSYLRFMYGFFISAFGIGIKPGTILGTNYGPRISIVARKTVSQ